MSDTESQGSEYQTAPTTSPSSEDQDKQVEREHFGFFKDVKTLMFIEEPTERNMLNFILEKDSFERFEK